MGHVARMQARGCAYRILVGRCEGKIYLEDPGVDERIILKRIFKKWNGSMDFIDLDLDRERCGLLWTR